MTGDDSLKLLVDLFQAYYNARRNKRSTYAVLNFEIDYESRLIELYQELISGTYAIAKSTCFLVTDPVIREVFAADFRDRIVHHLIYRYVYTLYDKYFIYDSYSCRIDKGTHCGVKWLASHMRSCSRNYTKDCYILKLDIKGFFMGIDKHILFQLLKDFLYQRQDKLTIPYEFLINLIQQIIFHDPTKHYNFQGDLSHYKNLPIDKSLFNSKQDTGLPIGNLTSQLFANIYLDSLDKYITKGLGCKYYGRYVDDFFLIHESKEVLLHYKELIQEFLSVNLRLTLHPKKIYLQHYTRGVKFLGTYIKPYVIYLNRRTISNRKKKIWKYNTGYSSDQKLYNSLNVYLGFAKHYKSYKLSRTLRGTLPNNFTSSYLLEEYICKKIV